MILEVIFLLVAIPMFLVTIVWLAAVICGMTEHRDYGFISYRKFKKYFNPEEWKAPSHFSNRVLIKDDFDISRMSPDSAIFKYEGKGMIPSSPYSFIMICRLLDKTVDSKKPKQPKRKIKW